MGVPTKSFECLSDFFCFRFKAMIRGKNRQISGSQLPGTRANLQIIKVDLKEDLNTPAQGPMLSNLTDIFSYIQIV
jgi:hypothetical protein